jgi:hypothetical protein
MEPRSVDGRPLEDEELKALPTEEDARQPGPHTAALIGGGLGNRNTCNWGVTIFCDDTTGDTCKTGWTFRCDTMTCTYGWTFVCDKGRF